MCARILLVEDDEDTSCFLQEALVRRGFEVHSVTLGADAIQTLVDNDWDVIVADVELAGMTGIELCTHVTEHRPDVPVVVVTDNGNFDAAVAAIRAGAYDF